MTVSICRTPLVKDCENKGKENICTTEYESECVTEHHEHLVEDDVPECRTVLDKKCEPITSGYTSSQKCSEWPREECVLSKQNRKKYSPKTRCEKIPITLCGPPGCGLLEGEEVCHERKKTIVGDRPEESCSLVPQTQCSYVTKLVPQLKEVENCFDMPKEVCGSAKVNPRKVAKPALKKWCFKEDAERSGHRLFTKSKKEDKDLRDCSRKLFCGGKNINSKCDPCPWGHARKPECASNSVDTEKYRTMDGSCNNRQQPLYGQQGTQMQRLLQSTYGNLGNLNNLPRLAKSGSQLPSARKVSQTSFVAGSPKLNIPASPHSEISVYFMQFGQFIDHDLTHSPAIEADCCLKDGDRLPWTYPGDPYNNKDYDCFPIEIPDNDKYWGKNRSCIEFARSEPSPSFQCTAGSREQMNDITHWLDGGNIYGNSKEEERNLRNTSDRSQLKSSRSADGRELLPSCASERERSNIAACGELCAMEPHRSCMFAGDFRVNEQPGLTVMHTVWIREHNRVAGELRDINMQWGAETIFQEARKIVIAEWQHIVYNEWLPILLGVNYMTTNNLLPLTSGYSRDYDEDTDPSTYNEFAAAAFRFGHSMIASLIPERDIRGRNISRLELKRNFNNASVLKEKGFIANSIRGYTQELAPSWDEAFVEDIINNLFEVEAGKGGMDLTALNIQRGRDHGIAGYNSYRKKCASASNNLNAASDFNELTGTGDGSISPDQVRKLDNLYDHVDDIDLYVGGTFEDKQGDSILGPTFLCIIGEQFKRLKRGDRFWYENGDFSKSRFSESQLKQIRKSSMARIVCDNTDITRIQPLVFKVAKGDNSFVQCNDLTSIPRLNFGVFKDFSRSKQAFCQFKGDGVGNVNGYVEISQQSGANSATFKLNLSGLAPGKHGFHVHEKGDLGSDCKRAGGHLNPFKVSLVFT